MAIDFVDYWLLFSKLFDTYNDLSTRLCIRLLAYWYSCQLVFVRWRGVDSDYFNIMTGVRQGGVLSPYLFRFYVRDVIHSITRMRVGCNIGGEMINLLCFADDMVLLAPSWDALQILIDTLYTLAHEINMSFNTNKTVCMVFSPSVSRKVVSHNFPSFTAGNTALKFVNQFKYLGNILTQNLRDDVDIEREIKCLFVRCNILMSRFKYCSLSVKLKLFQSYCICFYNTALWNSHNKATLDRFVSCYNKCVKRFFRFSQI